MKKTLFLVEDDTTIADMLSAYLEREGYDVIRSMDGESALTLFRNITPNLVILDLNLPGKSGLEILPTLRAGMAGPILVLSARIGEDDRVESLELGADDFIAKPFSARELLARINRHLHRDSQATSVASASDERLVVGKVVINTTLYTVEAGGELVKLTKTEFEILSHLFVRYGKVVERETLMREIIGYERYLSDRTIDTHMKNLRKKFEAYLDIETLRAVGYRLHIKP
jgi:DNA-binding response OmpR family regulator